MGAKVLIVQESLPQYRVPFFDGLRSRLASHDVVLDVAHGRPVAEVEARQDGGALDWALHLRNRRLGLVGHPVVWQPVYRVASDYDMVVVEQASRLLVNYALLAKQRGRGPDVAMWGHGAVRPTGPSGRGLLGRALKVPVCRLPRWWFAYTEGSARRVTALGFPAERITVVQNAVDTSWAASRGTSPKQPERCVFVGGLYAEKRLDFLIEACDEIARRRPGFELVVIGDGPERRRVASWAAQRPYLRHRGALFGEAKAAELEAATLVLNPGRVGLGVLDAFAAEAPMVTTDGPFHSPEVEYLRHGRNGWIAANEVGAYARAVDQLLDCGGLLAQLRTGCRQGAARYSLGAMIDRFTGGVVDACTATGSRLRDAA